MANSEEKILLQSNFDSTDILRIVESDFDKTIFENQSEDYIPGLFDFKDAISSTDVWNIRDLAKLTPLPLKDENKDRIDNISTGYICERPSFIPTNEKAYIYPLGDDELYRIKSDYYLGQGYIPLIRSDIESQKETIDIYNSKYSINSDYSTEFNTYYLGSASSSSFIYNLLKYTDGQSSWETNWSSNATVETQVDNVFFLNDLTKVSEKSSVDTTDIEFNSSISNLESGTYCLSFFIRVDDEIKDEIDYRKSDPTIVRYSPCKTWVKVSSNAFESINYYLHKGMEYSEEDTYVCADSLWRRVSICFTTNSSLDNATFKITWPKNYTRGILNQNRVNSLKIGGLLLENKSYPSTYDKRHVIYNNDSISEAKYYPLAIYFGKTPNLSKSSWTINYKRFIESCSAANSSFLDTIGKINIGYTGNKAVIIVDKNIVVSQKINDIDNFYNHNESVFISFNKDTSEFKVRVYCNKSYYEMSCIIEDTSVFKALTIKDELYKYHLLLGGTEPMALTPGFYKDVIFIPRILSEENNEENLMVNSYFAESISSYRYNRDYLIKPVNPKEITWDDFKNLESCNKNKYYKLTTDSTESEKEYKAGDILFCVSPFDKKLTIKEIPFHWSYTAFIIDSYKDIIDSTVLRAPLFIEGFEKIAEKGNNLIID